MKQLKEILESIFEKYFIHKIQVDWKDELKKIPEEILKEWMDEELLGQVRRGSTEVFETVKDEMERKYDFGIYMEVSDFVDDYKTKLEEVENEQAEEEEDEWDVDGEDAMIGEKMICPEATPECSEGDKPCTHAEIHDYDKDCNDGCDFIPQHIQCNQVSEHHTEEEISEFQKGDHSEKQVPTRVPDEIVETGGV